MPDLIATARRPARLPKTGRVSVRATRPAIVDLRFREDAWIVAGEGRARVCLGDYRMCEFAATSLDVPGLNNLFVSVRVGQARRDRHERYRRGL